MDKRTKGIIAKIGTAIMWTTFIVLWILFGWWYLTVGALIIHLLEAIFIGIKKGNKYGYKPVNSFFLTWLLGFTWWKYL